MEIQAYTIQAISRDKSRIGVVRAGTGAGI